MSVKYSIITICKDQLGMTMNCVNSILANTKDFELIIVNNGSDVAMGVYLDHFAYNKENIKVVHTNSNFSFSKANNIGRQHAVGEFLVFINNDTIVYTDWIERMVAHLDKVPLKNIGAIGPVTCMSNGRQFVGKQNAEQWYQQNKGYWSQAGILYGWCLMVKASIFDEVEGWDERFNNAYEDNDLSLKIQLAGYKLIIAMDTYIDHIGQGTLLKEINMEEYYLSGLVNRKRYFDKWQSPIKKKLVAVYRTNCGEHLEESLKQTSKFADKIIINFCRAPEVVKDKPLKEYITYLINEFPKISTIGIYNGPHKEHEERNWLLARALELYEKGLADWCISVDDDEIYEDKFVERVQSYMNPPNPEIFGYWCQWRTIWKKELGKEYFRTDSTFGQFSNYRFFRLMPNQEIISNHPEGFHCGSNPIFAPENLRWLGIRVKHLGYDSPEQRQRKYEFYEKTDTHKDKSGIGFEDYSHLIEKNPKLEVYREDNGISLVMMVKNEARGILGCLEQVQHLVDEYVIVDTGSTDNTLEIVKDFAKTAHVPVKILEYNWEDNYSTPRNFGKYYATQHWILVLDADERFGLDAVKEIFRVSETECDLFTFKIANILDASTKPPKVAPTRNTRMFKNIPEFFYTGLIHETIDDSVIAYRKKHKMFVMESVFVMNHYGYLISKEKNRKKLDYYESINLKQIELTDGMDARPFFNLALHYINDDKKLDAVNMLKKSIEINPNFWHAQQQMAIINLQSAREYLKSSLRYCPTGHPFRDFANDLLGYLDKNLTGNVKVT